MWGTDDFNGLYKTKMHLLLKKSGQLGLWWHIKHLQVKWRFKNLSNVCVFLLGYFFNVLNGHRCKLNIGMLSRNFNEETYQETDLWLLVGPPSHLVQWRCLQHTHSFPDLVALCFWFPMYHLEESHDDFPLRYLVLLLTYTHVDWKLCYVHLWHFLCTYSLFCLFTPSHHICGYLKW